MPWLPQVADPALVSTLPLSPLQGYVLSRLDGRTDLPALTQLLGLPTARVEELLTELVALGAVLAEPLEPTDEASPGHRAYFETHLRDLSADQRVALATSAQEPTLSALCFDPLAQVIIALLDNARFGPSQARLVARHHHTPQGLDALLNRAAFAQDASVRRSILQNPQLSPATFRRLWQMRRLIELHSLSVSREVVEHVKKAARETLRARFNSATAEERVEVLLKTEGRCLTQLIGMSVDSKTTSLLCSRPLTSVLLIQNFARWSAAPPPLIAHLLRQEVVRRTASLRAMLERHPNAPKI